MSLFGANCQSSFYLVATPRHPTRVGQALPTPRRPQRHALIATTALASALACIGWADGAQAQAIDACGPQRNGSVVCTPGGNPYPDGIAYAAQPAIPGEDVTDPQTEVLDLSIALETGVAVVLPGAAGQRTAVRGEGYQLGNVTIDAAAGSSVRTYGTRQAGIAGIVQDGELLLTAADVHTAGTASRAVLGIARGAGNVAIAADAIETAGARSHAVVGYGYGGGAVTIDAGRIATTGAGANGIYSYSSGGPVTITAGAIDTRGDGALGILAANGGAQAIIVDGTVSTAGAYSGGVAVRGGATSTSTVAINGSVATQGFASDGVSAGAFGDVMVSGTGSVGTAGAYSSGVTATSTAGNVVVDLATVTTTGDSSPAVRVLAGRGAVDLRVGAATTSGTGSGAVEVIADADIRAALESVATSGTLSNGVRMTSYAAIDLTVGNIATSGSDSIGLTLEGQRVAANVTDAIVVTGDAAQSTAAVILSASPSNYAPEIEGAGLATLDNDGVILAAGANVGGVSISGTNGVTVSGGGTIESRGDQAAGLGFASGGATSIAQGMIRTAGDYAFGIVGTAAGAIDIKVDAIETAGLVGDGVRLTRDGTTATSVDIGSIALAGYASTGVNIRIAGGAGGAGATGAIDVSLGTLRASGDNQSGIVIDAAYADVAVALGDAELTGVNSSAIYALGRNVAVSAGSVFGTGDADAMRALVEANAANGLAAIAVTDRIEALGTNMTALRATGDTVLVSGAGNVFSAQGVGISVESRGDAAIAIGQAAGGGDYGHAIDARTAGDLAISADGVTATGASGYGINAEAGGTAVVVVGSAATTGDLAAAISVRAAGDVTLAATAIATGGYNSFGINVLSQGGNIAVAASDIRTSGDQSRGLRLENLGDGTIDVIADNITTTGDYANGMSIISAGSGLISVDASNVTTSGDVSSGMAIQASNAAVVVNASDFTASGQSARAIDIFARSIDLTNSGTLIATRPVEFGFAASAQTLVLQGYDSVRVRNDGVIAVDGDVSQAMSLRSNGQIVVDSTGTILVSGFGASGIGANALGDITINAAQVRSVGTAINSITAVSRGTVTVNLDRFEGTGSGIGILAQSFGGDTRVDVGTMRLSNGSSIGSLQATGLTTFHNRGTITSDLTTTLLDIFAGDISTTFDGDIISIDAVPRVAGGLQYAMLSFDTTEPRVSNPLSTFNIDFTNNALIKMQTNGFSAVNLRSNNDITIDGTGRVEVIGMFNGGYKLTAEGAITIDQASITADGAFSYGIDAVSGGDFSVRSGSITTTGGVTPAITAMVGGDAMLDIGTIATSGRLSNGVTLIATGAAEIAIGQLSTNGNAADGMNVSAAGPLSVTLGSGSANGEQAAVARLQSGTAIDFRSTGSLAVAGAGSTAVSAASPGSIAIDTGAIDVSGADSRAIVAQAGIDLTVRTNGAVSSSAVQSVPQTAAIDLLGGTSATLTNIGGIVTTGAGNAGVSIASNGIAALAGSGGVSTRGDDATAVKIAGQQGASARQASAIATYGNRSFGLQMTSGGDAAVYLGSVSTFGDNSAAVDVRAQGDVLVSVANIATGGALSDGLVVRTNGAAAVELGAVAVSGAGSYGAFVSALGDATVTVGNVAVSGAGARGIETYVDGDGLITITGTVTGSADQLPRPQVVPLPGGRVADRAQSIIAGDSFGTTTIVNNGAIITSGAFEGGIAARGFAGVTVSGSGTIATSGDGATGIYAGANTNLAKVEVTSVATTGDDARGIFVRSFGTGYGIADTITTRGDRSIGLLVEGANVAAASVRQVTTSGALAHGVVAHAYGSAYAVAGDITVSGAGAIGVDAASYQQGDAIVVVAGQVTATGGGSAIGAYAANGQARVFASRVVHAGDSNGILATGATGVVVEFGSVTSTGDNGGEAIFAEATRGTTVVEGMAVTAIGRSRDAITARNITGDIDVMVGAASASGLSSAGIFAEGAGAVRIMAGSVRNDAGDSAAIIARGGTVAITVGAVTASGSGATPQSAIDAQANGDAIVSVGTVAATGGHDGVTIAAGGTAALDVAGGGGVSALRNAVVLAGAGGNMLTNGGTIVGGVAVRAEGGAATIVNRGTIVGALALTANADRIANGGELYLAAGTGFAAGADVLDNAGSLRLAGNVDFGAGDDRLVNSGTLRLAMLGANGLPTTATTAVSRTIAGLESTVNTGAIDLRNGIAGDVLSLSGSFSGSDASTLGVDVAFGATTVADRLVIAGAATGSTRIALQAAGTALTLEPGVTLVQAGSGTLAGAFTLDPSQIDAGFFQRGLLFDATNTTFRLVSAPSTGAYRLLKASEGARTLALESADAVSAHLAVMRDGRETSGGMWFVAGGAGAARDEVRGFSTFGLGQTADLGYKQDGFSGQYGIDLTRGSVTFGVTGGYATSVLGFDRSADRIEYDVYNIGLYGAVRSGPIFANLLGKYDRYDLDVRVAGQRGDTDADGFSARGEAGLRLGGRRFFVEPAIKLSWTTTRIDALPLAATLDFDDRRGWTGAAGLRFGGGVAVGGAQVTLYGAADYVRTFDADQGVTFSTGATRLSIGDTALPDYAVGKLGVTIDQGAVSGFIEGTGRYSDDYRGFGGRAGLRIRF